MLSRTNPGGRCNATDHWKTNKYANGGKHSTIKPVRNHPIGELLVITGHSPKDCRILRSTVLEPAPETLEPGADLGYVYVADEGPNPGIEVDHQIGTAISIDRDVWVDSWYQLTQIAIARFLSKLSEPPPEMSWPVIVDPATHP